VLLKKVDPQVVEVTLDIPVAKVMDIQVDWKGKLADNLILERVALVPDRVKVVGGSRILKDIATIYTEKVPLDAITSSGEISVNLALRPASLVLANELKDKVLVKFRVAPRD
jgi:YbbR domain-containing protein